MTDPTPAGAEKPLFEMVPTSAAYMELVAQVAELHDDIAHLQANSLAITDDADGDTDTAGHVLDVSAQIEMFGYRLDRHRAEIENTKRRLNDVIEFLKGSGIAKTPPAETVAPDTAAS